MTDDDVRVLEECRRAVGVPSKFGHSDVGDVFVRYLQGEFTADEAVDFLAVTFPYTDGEAR